VKRRISLAKAIEDNYIISLRYFGSQSGNTNERSVLVLGVRSYMRKRNPLRLLAYEVESGSWKHFVVDNCGFLQARQDAKTAVRIIGEIKSQIKDSSRRKSYTDVWGVWDGIKEPRLFNNLRAQKYSMPLSGTSQQDHRRMSMAKARRIMEDTMGGLSNANRFQQVVSEGLQNYVSSRVANAIGVLSQQYAASLYDDEYINTEDLRGLIERMSVVLWALMGSSESVIKVSRR
jgi:hypothetical protein